MPMEKKSEDRRRTEAMRVTATPSELEELRIAAERAGMALSVFVRVKALEGARKLDTKAA